MRRVLPSQQPLPWEPLTKRAFGRMHFAPREWFVLLICLNGTFYEKLPCNTHYLAVGYLTLKHSPRRLPTSFPYSLAEQRTRDVCTKSSQYSNKDCPVPKLRTLPACRSRHLWAEHFIRLYVLFPLGTRLFDLL